MNTQNALVLSGGGTKGSWEAGVLRYLADQGHPGFHFISGSSVGAIITGGLAMFPPERFSEGAAFVEQIWRERITASRSIWRLRVPLGIPGLWRPSFGLNAPLHRLLQETVDIERIRASGIKLRISSVDLLTGTLKVYDESTDDIVQAILASSAFPIAFPPVAIGDRLEVDGAVRDFAPVRAAIDAGATNITALLTERGDHLSRVTPRQVSTSFRVTQRLLRIIFHEIIHNDLHQCERINSLLDRGLLQEETSGYRRIHLTVIQPSAPLAGPLEFGAGLIDAQIRQGYEDARATLGG
jgi:NTE family protein